jgi:crotonobetainyl-CoA:carnitine CoA-transferase CaiB-like acyl-CoA transferase
VELDRDPIVRFCGKLMRGLGAHVTRLAAESPEDLSDAEQAAAFFLDSGKSALPADGPVDGANPVVARALAAADVALISGRPDELSSRGLDYQALSAVNAGIVLGRVTRFGDGGEWSGYAGSDYEVGALSGLMRIVGEPGRAPLRLGGTQSDFTTAVTLFTGLQFALFGRSRTGQGSEVTTSAVRAAAALDWKSSIYYEVEGKTLERGSDRGPFVPATKDGHVGFYYRAEDWPAVKAVTGAPELADERFATQPGRDANRAELAAILGRAAARFTKKELYEQAQARRIPVGYVMTLADIPDDAQLRARGAVSQVTLPGGVAAWLPQPPWTVDGTRFDWFGAPDGDAAGEPADD